VRLKMSMQLCALGWPGGEASTSDGPQRKHAGEDGHGSPLTRAHGRRGRDRRPNSEGKAGGPTPCLGKPGAAPRDRALLLREAAEGARPRPEPRTLPWATGPRGPGRETGTNPARAAALASQPGPHAGPRNRPALPEAATATMTAPAPAGLAT